MTSRKFRTLTSLYLPGVLYQLLRDARLPASRRDELAHKRLETALVSAYRHVPYYRQMMQDIGYSPLQDYQGPEDLARFPITSRQDLNELDIGELVREGSDLAASHCDSTSGSTGIPLPVYRDPHDRAIEIALWLRVLFSNGYNVRDRTLSLTSPKRLEGERSLLQRFGLLRRRAVDYRWPPSRLIEVMLDYGPNVVYGNRTHLLLLATELIKLGMAPYDLKLLVGTAEVVRESHRELLRKAFGTLLVENYGSVEMGSMAYETPGLKGLHLCDDLVHFEFLDADGRPVSAGQPGRVIVTDLLIRLMPFIRYEHGDWAVFEYRSMPSGQAVRVITEVIRRDSDLAILPGGIVRPFNTFDIIMMAYHGVSQYRFVQRTQDRIEVLIACEPVYFERIRHDLVPQLAREFGAGICFEPIHVERIDPDPTGKLRTFVSEVAQ